MNDNARFNLNYLIDASLNGPGDIDSHLMTLFSLSLSMNAKTIIELGVRTGQSTAPFVLAAEKTNGMVHSVDTKSAHFSMPSSFNRYWKFHQQCALEFLSSWDGDKPDIIFIDDFHTYDHVKKELEIVEKLIDGDSIVLLHDLMHHHTYPNYSYMLHDNPQWLDGGPARAVLELDKRKWEWSTIPRCHGLTILRKTKEYSYESYLDSRKI